MCGPRETDLPTPVHEFRLILTPKPTNRKVERIKREHVKLRDNKSILVIQKDHLTRKRVLYYGGKQ